MPEGVATMIVILVICAVASAGGMFFGFVEQAAVWADPRATVFQQVSARLTMGFSFLTFVVSAGLAALLAQGDRKIAEAKLNTEWTVDKLRPVPPPVPPPVVPLAPLSDMPRAAEAVAEEDGIRIGNFLVRQKPRQDPTSEAAAQLYGKPPALR